MADQLARDLFNYDPRVARVMLDSLQESADLAVAAGQAAREPRRVNTPLPVGTLVMAGGAGACKVIGHTPGSHYTLRQIWGQYQDVEYSAVYRDTEQTWYEA